MKQAKIYVVQVTEAGTARVAGVCSHGGQRRNIGRNEPGILRIWNARK